MPRSPLYTEAFFETVSDWHENTPDNVELAYLAWGQNNEQPEKNESFKAFLKSFEQMLHRRGHEKTDQEKMRCLAVFAVLEGAVVNDYVVIVDDGDGTGIRSWAVASDLVSQHANKPLYGIPGACERDDVLIPFVGEDIMGGLGSTALYMYPYDQAVGSIAQFNREGKISRSD